MDTIFIHRHLINENNLKYTNYVKPKQKTAEETKNENFDVIH